MLLYAIGSLLLVVLLRSYSVLQLQQHKKMIVYNVPRHTAIDFMEGRSFHFLGSPFLLENKNLINFHLAAARQQNRVQFAGVIKHNFFRFHGKTILQLDHPIRSDGDKQIPVAVLIISGNAKIDMKTLQKNFLIEQLVIDSSVPFYKATALQQQCAQLRIRCHNVAAKGAFVMNLQTPTFAAS